ncbi:MAG: YiiD C-terminal domain-containing protein [Pseudomonadota bacterium]
MSPAELTAYLHQHIPLTAALGARVLRSEKHEIEIRAPFAPNINHRGTAFGGSLATMGILSGWAVLHQALSREKILARLVIQKSECDFAEPVNVEFTAVSRITEKDWTKFVTTLKRYNKARITALSQIHAEGVEAVTHKGTYVALL